VNEKRRDRKNRILREGESQCADGRYRFSYYEGGKKKSFYSWKLNETDPIPTGKRECVSLREQEKDYYRRLEEGISSRANNMRVVDLVKKYVKTRNDVRITTKNGYKTVLNILEAEPFGRRRISDIRISDAKTWFIKLQQDDGRSYTSIHTIRGVLRPAFQSAVDDDLIFKNPFDFQLHEVLDNDTKARDALSPEMEQSFLNFIKNDDHYCRYYDGIYILLNTGVRISEFVGLTASDIDMENRTISVNHQLMRSGRHVYVQDSAKTKSGTRVIPMDSLGGDSVYQCFRRILENRKEKKLKEEPAVDGYSGFLFLDKDNNPMVALHWEHYFKFIVQKHNKKHSDKPLPRITPHVCRHTYCTKQIRRGMTPSALAYLMGHSGVDITLNRYTHIKYEDAVKECQRLDRS